MSSQTKLFLQIIYELEKDVKRDSGLGLLVLLIPLRDIIRTNEPHMHLQNCSTKSTLILEGSSTVCERGRERGIQWDVREALAVSAERVASATCTKHPGILSKMISECKQTCHLHDVFALSDVSGLPF